MKTFPAKYTISIALILIAVLIIAPAMAGETSTTVHVVKLANDGTTIINQTTVTYGWMETNLPVMGDETTDYYLQGPVFSGDRWNPSEDSNLKNWGRNKGTDVKDLCNLVGGMAPGETVKIWDGGFSKTFPYVNVYTPDPRQGPMIISWWWNGTYVPGFSDGMRLLFLADTSTNPFGYHCYGAWDMNQTLDPEYHYFFYNSGDPTPFYPSTTGLSVKYVNEIIIYSNDPAPVAPVAAFTADVTNGQVPLTVHFTDASTGTSPLSYAWDFTNDGTVESTIQSPTYTYTTAGTYTVNLTVTNAQGVDSEIKASYIVVNSAVSPEYSLLLTGDHSVTLTKAQIEAIVTSGPSASWTDSSNQRTWQGIPLYYLVGAVDDADTGFNFNSTRASLNYVVQVRANDGFFRNFSSSTIASNDNYIVANSLNGSVIPFTDPTNSAKYWWPLKLAGSGPTGGNSVGNITEIRLIGLPAAPVAPVSDFTANTTLGNVPLTVQFTDSSTGTPTAWSWDFNNDGTIDSTIQNPVYSYSISGVYSVNMTASNAGGPNSRLKSNYINVTQSVPVVDTIFDGTVTLTPGETFTVQAYNNLTGVYTINRTTPLGALDKVATLQGFTYNVTDSRWSYDKVLLLDDLGQYIRKNPNYWYTYVNGVYKDGYQNTPNGLNVIELNTNDQVNFYYAPNKDPNPILNATAVVKITVNIGGSEPVPDWTLSLSGAKTQSVTKTFFEQGLACPSSGHQVFWTDVDGSVWGGVPLWVLVAMVDDSPDVGPDHFNFNDGIAAQGYSVKVISDDGWDTTLSSQNIARNNSIIVANTLNGTPLPLLTPAGKRSWPLHLKGAAVFGGQQVGNITSIQLTGLPQPPTEWTLRLQGDVTDIITQSYFVDAIACHHNVTWTDPSTGTVWEGVSLWDLAGAVDDIETSSHYTFNDTRATMGYTIRVSDAVGYNATFASATVAHNDGFFVAYKMNGTALTGSVAPLKLVGPATTSGKQRVGGITKISLEGLADQYPAGNWQLNLNGKISDLIPQGEFEYWAACHSATYIDTNGNVYTGVPLWRLLGWVDDRIPHGPNGFDDAAATAGYKVIVKAGDGYAKEFTSQQIGKTNAFIVANTYNGGPIPNDGSHPPYPLRLVGSGATGGNSVGNVVEIQLTDFQTPVAVPTLHIIKYGSDGTTVINETTIDYNYMESNLPVIGDGITAYKFEGLTLNPSNLWDPEETYPGGYKISNVVKGTPVHDLAELVGGMGSGTTITFVASDGFETTLPYSSIYTNPAVQARQGDAVLAWWGDGQYVPNYADGMRLFFMPSDHVYGQWDMHETLPSQYWRYNFQDNIQYPSCAGLSAKFITTIKVYSSPESDWTLELDGRDIGGVNYTVAKPFLEEAIACQFGADHKATYTDSNGRVWEGMPLWFFAGFVDDADQHSANAYNMTKALAGYNIVITGKDGYSTTISSKDVIRSSNYLIANSLNGTHIAEEDDSWPLRLVGQNVSGQNVVKKVASIKLTPQTPVVPTVSLVPVTSNLPIGQNSQYQLVMNSLPNGLSGYDLVITLADSNIGKIVNVTYPTWAGISNTSTLPANSVKISAVDVNKLIQAGSENTVLASITVRGDVPGTSAITISSVDMDADGGNAINPAIVNGQLSVYSPLNADFTADRTTGTASANVTLNVNFTDLSTGNPMPTAWQWAFGTGSTSTLQNPMASYHTPGNYTVSLTASNIFNQATMTKAHYIVVTPFVKSFPGYTNLPTDTNGDYLMEDINGNGRLDYDDVVAFYQNMDWISAQSDVGVAPYDFNHNGRIDYDDLVLLYWIVLG